MNPGQDLFSQQWTEGNLYAIDWLVPKLGSFACTVISIVGFGIVIFSILKNALTGLYVVNPRFWDQVDQIKNDVTSGASNMVNGLVSKVPGQGNAAAQKLGGVFTYILSHIPNVKSLTDFGDPDAPPVDKKQWFAHSLPLLVVQIFIGMMIFFGYPAKIAEWIGTGGTYILTAMIENYDPISVVQGLSDSFTVYSLSTDGSQDPFEQNINAASREMMAVVATHYNDMKGDPAQSTAYAIEANLMQAFDSETIRQVMGAAEGYNLSFSATYSNILPNPSQNYAATSSGVYIAQATNGTFSYRYWIPGISLPTGSTKVGDQDFFIISVTATPAAISNTSNANLIIFAGADFTTGSASGDGTVSFPIKGITFGSGTGDLHGTLGQVMTMEAIDGSGNVVATISPRLQTAAVSGTSGQNAVLSISSADRTTIMGTSNVAYWRLNLVGSWSLDVPGNTANSTTAVRVTEIRLVPGATTATYGLSTWTDMDVTKTSGISSLTGILSKGSSTE